MRDAEKRRRNVVITGLGEDTGMGDREMAHDLFTSELGVSTVQIVSAIRLGKPMGRCRKLLVTFVRNMMHLTSSVWLTD